MWAGGPSEAPRDSDIFFVDIWPSFGPVVSILNEGGLKMATNDNAGTRRICSTLN